MPHEGRTALYRFYNSSDQLLYVGIAADPKERWAQHAADKTWWAEVIRRDVEWIPSRAAAEIAERDAIAAEKPQHNSRHALPALTSEAVSELFAEYKQVVDRERELRGPMRTAAAQELWAGVTVGQLAKLTGLTDEVFRRLARAEGVERKRPPVRRSTPTPPAPEES